MYACGRLRYGDDNTEPDGILRLTGCSSPGRAAGWHSHSHALKAGALEATDPRIIESGNFLATPALFRGDETDHRITVADSTGVAVQDVAVARLALDANTALTGDGHVAIIRAKL